MTAFHYLEIRPAVTDSTGTTESFLGEVLEFNSSIGDYVRTPSGALAEAEAFADIRGGEVVWTLYGRCTDGTSLAIGDYRTFDDALEILNAIIAPMAAARDLILARGSSPDARRAAADLDDFINQSTNNERL